MQAKRRINEPERERETIHTMKNMYRKIFSFAFRNGIRLIYSIECHADLFVIETKLKTNQIPIDLPKYLSGTPLAHEIHFFLLKLFTEMRTS